MTINRVTWNFDAMTKLNEYVLMAEAAHRVEVSQNTLRTWAADGRIAMHRNPAKGYGKPFHLTRACRRMKPIIAG